MTNGKKHTNRKKRKGGYVQKSNSSKKRRPQNANPVGKKPAFLCTAPAKHIKRAENAVKCGEIVKLTDRFGFARLSDGLGDVFLPGRDMQGAMPGDKVNLVLKTCEGHSPEGRVTEIIEQNNTRFTGRVTVEGGRVCIMPDSYCKFAIKICKRDTTFAAPGERVVAQIIKRGRSHFYHEAEIIAALGDSEDMDSSIFACLVTGDINPEFSPEVSAAAVKVGAMKISEKDREHRRDLRDKPIFTIDGADTKDIDDAISLEKTDDGYLLGVHIADVSHYVRRGSVLDREAYARGTSVYYADRVAPMLPRELSNGICSLNEGEDRLAFSCLLTLDKKGRTRRYTFEKTIIRSRVKGVYSEINTILKGEADSSVLKKYSEVIGQLDDMIELSRKLTAARLGRGGFDIESQESKIVTRDGHTVKIVPCERGESEMMIEEFMLKANEAAATFGEKNKIPFLYRTHDVPDPVKIKNFVSVLKLFGVHTEHITPENFNTKAVAEMLEEQKDTPLYGIISNQLLRCMAKAKYTDYNIGHYGLVLERYSHFTSPIRRYPDLAIHRIMSDMLSCGDRTKITVKYADFVSSAAVQSSVRELAAVTAERDCEDICKADYMRTKIGEIFEGTVYSVMPHGMYVSLPDTVEGMVSVESMNAFEFDPERPFEMRCRNGKKYQIGSAVRVRLVNVDISRGNIDFEIDN